MKKIFKRILFATLGVFALASCEDVPAPYKIPGTGNQQDTKINTFYSSASCSDWSMLAGATGNNPWSQGSSYTQATGYQKWDGADAKSNRMADGFLISPGFPTVTDSTTAYISFQYCVGYATNDAQFADHIKLYVSKQYVPVEGFVAEKWTQLDWKATHTSTNWELATTTVVLPAEFLNQEKVNIAFYFTTPDASKSSTFEIKDLKVVAGTPSASGEGGEETPASSKEKPLTVSQAKSGSGNNYVKGYIVGYVDGQNITEGAKFSVPSSAETEILLAETPDETNPDNVFPVQLPQGDIRNALELSTHPNYLKKEVLLYGSLETYFGMPGMKGTSWGSIDGQTFGKDPEGGESGNPEAGTPEGDGTKDKPYNVAAVISYVQGLGADVTSPNEVYVKGVVKSNNTTEATISQYGNMNFIMIDKGFENAEFQAYQVYGLGAKKFTSATDIKPGDEVIVYGKVVNYRGNTPETTGKGSAYVYSINGKTEEGQSEEPQTGTEVTCAKAVELANALDDNATSTETYTVTGYITELVGDVSTKTGSPQQTFWMADTKDGGKVFEAYFANVPTGVEKFIKGSKVKITGQLMKYVKNGEVTPEIKNANVVILEVGDGGGEQGEEPSGDAAEYAIRLSYSVGNYVTEGVATINGVADCPVLKIGTSTKPGDFTLQVPAGKHRFYAVTWKGTESADVVLKNGENVLKTVSVKGNEGATANPPYTLTVTAEDKYEFEVSADCTLTVTSDKRIIFFGIQ